MSTPFTPKLWKNRPSQETPLNADGLIDLETRVTDWAGTQGGLISFVATLDDLPTDFGVDEHPVYLVLSTPPSSLPALRAWTGTTWAALGGGGGASGPGGGATLPNLYVQQTEPDGNGIIIDSLWIPTNVDGTNKTLDQWEVFTGTGEGDGGNLIISIEAPVPEVDALWIPLNQNGTPKYIDEWVVFTGRGTVFGFGNENLVIQQPLPTSPVLGTLFIPLGSDEVARSFDNWRIFT